jgi:hypothetical protein
MEPSGRRAALPAPAMHRPRRPGPLAEAMRLAEQTAAELAGTDRPAWAWPWSVARTLRKVCSRETDPVALWPAVRHCHTQLAARGVLEETDFAEDVLCGVWLDLEARSVDIEDSRRRREGKSWSMSTSPSSPAPIRPHHRPVRCPACRSHTWDRPAQGSAPRPRPRRRPCPRLLIRPHPPSCWPTAARAAANANATATAVSGSAATTGCSPSSARFGGTAEDTRASRFFLRPREHNPRPVALVW